jgi:metal-responsive CopG/Arc/MetJ family transcriptional regulator
MGHTKIAITHDQSTLDELNRLVGRQVVSNRSKVIREAVKEKLERLTRSRLARECTKLDPASEKALAGEGMLEIGEWLEY